VQTGKKYASPLFFTDYSLPALAGKHEPVMANSGNAAGNVLPATWPAMYYHQFSHSCILQGAGMVAVVARLIKQTLHHSHSSDSVLFNSP